MALSNNQPNTTPGRFCTKDRIVNIDYVRNQLAVKVAWKQDCSKVVTYRVKKNVTLPVKTGPVGPQIDLVANKYLPGGGSQIMINLPKGANLMEYFEPISVRTIE